MRFLPQTEISYRLISHFRIELKKELLSSVVTVMWFSRLATTKTFPVPTLFYHAARFPSSFP